MGRVATRPFRKSATAAAGTFQPIKNRVGCSAQSPGCMSLRNLTVTGVGSGSPYANWAQSTSYVKGNVRVYGGQQYVCHTDHTSTSVFSGITNWYELRPFPYFAALFADMTNASESKETVYAKVRSENPACLLFQYKTIDVANLAAAQQGLNLYTWLNTNKGWLYSNEPGTGGNEVTPANIGYGGQKVINFSRPTIVDSNGDNFAAWHAKQLASQWAGIMPDGWALDNSVSMCAYNTAGGPPVWTNNGADYVGSGGGYPLNTDMWGTGYWRAGVSEASNDTDVVPLLQAGFVAAWDALRKYTPQARLWPNGGIKLPDSWRGKFDAMEFEGGGGVYASENTLANGWLQIMVNVYRACTLFALGSRFKGTMDFNTFSDPEGSVTTQPIHKDILYGLCSSLLTDAFFAWVAKDVAGVNEAAYRVWIAEYEVQLGVPVEAAPAASWSNGVWKREYQNGLVLVHPRLTLTGWENEPDRTVTLPFACRRLTGTLDPADNGSLLSAGSTVSLPCRTGLILLKA